MGFLKNAKEKWEKLWLPRLQEGKTKIEQAKAVGQLIATKAMKAGITTIVFDRSGYIYHGRVKALAEGARGERKEDGTNELLQF